MESIFELAGNLCLILTKLDLEHGLAQPQLVVFYFCFADAHKLLIAYTLISGKKEEISIESIKKLIEKMKPNHDEQGEKAVYWFLTSWG